MPESSSVSGTQKDAHSQFMGEPKPVADQSAASSGVKDQSSAQPIKIVIIHGDPTKANDILPGGFWDEDDHYTIVRAREALKQLEPKYSFIWLCNHDTLIEDLRRLKQQNQIDLVLQLCDEGWMNNSRMELHVTAFLEMLDLSYTGAGPKCIGTTYDKQGVLKIVESIGVPVPRSVYVDDLSDPVALGLQYPIIVKPNSTDGSFGITAKSVCHSFGDVQLAMQEIRQKFYIRGPVLYQEFLTGRDINVGVMERLNEKSGEMEPWVLPITEEDYSALPDDLPKICGFESKWDESSPYYQIKTRPTTLSLEMQQQISEHSKRVFKRIECRDYARFDWRLDGSGRPRLLEANPNCGWCWDGHLPKTCNLAGIDYPHFFETVIKSGLHRKERMQKQRQIDSQKKFVHVGRNGAEALVSPSSALSSNGTSPVKKPLDQWVNTSHYVSPPVDH